MNGAALPEDSATIYGILDAMPRAAVNRVLTVFFNNLYRVA